MSPMSPRLLRPRATGFSPTQIAGLAAWWDASDTSTVTLSSGNVSEWRDKSGASRHLTQATAANRPAYTSAAQNGRNGVAFTGSSSHSLEYASGIFTFSGGGTVFAVSKGVTRPTNNNYGPFLAEGTATSDSMLGLVTGVYATSGFRPSTDIFQPSGVRPTSTFDGSLPLVLSWRWSSWQNHKTNGETAIGVNGNSVAVEAYGVSAPADFTSGSPVYRVGRAGNSVNSEGFLTATVCEVIAYNRAITTAQRQRVEGYLAWKWGLQATLPFDHPYAASFPGYGTQATPTDADALAYLSAVRTADGGTGVEVGVANAVDGFVKGCKADGIWSAIKASCILAGARTLSGALVPLAGSAPTNVNFVAADYNRRTGLIGNGSTKYLNSNRAANADGQDDFHMSLYASSAATNAGGTSSAYAGGGGNPVSAYYSYNGIYRFNAVGASDGISAYSRTGDFASVAGKDTVGFIGMSRSASASFVGRGGGSNTTVSQTSRTPNNNSIALFAFNELGVVNKHSDVRLAFYAIGSSLDLALLDSRLTRLINEAQYTLNTGLSGSSYATETLAYINAGYAAGGTLA